MKKQEKLDYLANHSFTTIDWQKMAPDENHTWLTSGLQAEFAEFLPLGTKEGKAVKGEIEGVVFKVYGCGVVTGSDAYVYNFDATRLKRTAQKMEENYHAELDRWNRKGRPENLEEFLKVDVKVLKWIRHTKRCLLRGKEVSFAEAKVRHSLYRPFCRQFYYFERVFNEDIYHFPKIFPTPATETENRVICVSDIGYRAAYSVLMTNLIPEHHLCASIDAVQCFPFYTYSEDGSQRQENITNWVLKHFQTHYRDATITKWDIFYYVYGLLHHPTYRDKYAANLKRELPRIPLPKLPQKRQKEKVPPLPGGKRGAFWVVSHAGKQLAELHLNYEQQPAYPLQTIVTPGVKPHYRVDKMRLTKEKDALIYNDALTLTGIPAAVFDYRLGNRSALEWVLDQYQVTVDGQSGNREKLEWLNDYQAKTAKGSGILNDPNRRDDEQYILRLISQVMTVSLETLKIVKELVESVQFT